MSSFRCQWLFASWLLLDFGRNSAQFSLLRLLQVIRLNSCWWMMAEDINSNEIKLEALWSGNSKCLTETPSDNKLTLVYGSEKWLQHGEWSDGYFSVQKNKKDGHPEENKAVDEEHVMPVAVTCVDNVATAENTHIWTKIQLSRSDKKRAKEDCPSRKIKEASRTAAKQPTIKKSEVKTAELPKIETCNRERVAVLKKKSTKERFMVMPSAIREHVETQFDTQSEARRDQRAREEASWNRSKESRFWFVWRLSSSCYDKTQQDCLKQPPNMHGEV
uniref:Uncharacterized protein n=1 Tax=Ditylenchus dipsaci TaxID=166011 RepID=A0A915DB09_9BILA